MWRERSVQGKCPKKGQCAGGPRLCLRNIPLESSSLRTMQCNNYNICDWKKGQDCFMRFYGLWRIVHCFGDSSMRHLSLSLLLLLHLDSLRILCFETVRIYQTYMLLFLVQIPVSRKIAILNPCYRCYFYAHVFGLSNFYFAVSLFVYICLIVSLGSKVSISYSYYSFLLFYQINMLRLF